MTREEVGGRKVTLALALLAILAALLVPSARWVSLFQTAPEPSGELLLGATLFRWALGSLALYVVVASRLGYLPGAKTTSHLSAPMSRLDAAVLGSILVAAAVLRMYGLDSDLWVDEITVVQYSRLPFGEIVTTYLAQNQHFLYSLLARSSLLLFGEAAWTLRLPAVLFGLGGIAALYLFSREVSDRGDAILASLLLAFSYHHIWFSQNARGYTGLLFWTLIASWLFVRGLHAPQSRTWLFYGISVALGIYTHQTMLFVVLGHVLIYLWNIGRPSERSRERWWAPLVSGFALSGLLTFSLHALTIPQIFGPALADLSLVPTWRNPLWTLRESLAGLRIGLGGALGVLLAAAVFAAGCLSFLRRRPIVLFVAALPVLLGASIVLAIRHPLWPRFFFFVMGFATLIVARGARELGERAVRPIGRTRRVRRSAGIALAGAVVAVSASSVFPVYRPKQDFSGARDFVESVRKPGEAIVAIGLAAFAYRTVYAPDWLEARTAAELEEIRRSGPRTWVVYTLPLHMASHHAELLEVVQSEYELVRAFPGSLGDGTVFVYEEGAPSSPPAGGTERQAAVVRHIRDG